jgi:hypothetical protein
MQRMNKEGLKPRVPCLRAPQVRKNGAMDTPMHLLTPKRAWHDGLGNPGARHPLVHQVDRTGRVVRVRPISAGAEQVSVAEAGHPGCTHAV